MIITNRSWARTLILILTLIGTVMHITGQKIARFHLLIGPTNQSRAHTIYRTDRQHKSLKFQGATERPSGAPGSYS